jgi:enoyl-CoA hydratase
MNYNTIIYSIQEGIARLSLNRPDFDNVVSLEMAAEVKSACSDIRQREDVRVVLISGEGERAFCAGEDAEDFGRVSQEERVNASCLAERITQIEVPIVAAVKGNASGIGLALALACDIRIASEGAVFSVQDNGTDYLLPTGLTQLLPRIVGIGKASEMLLVRGPVDAQEAQQTGLVHRVFPLGEVMAESEKLARSMALKAPVALRYAKEAVFKGMDLTLDQGLGLELDLYVILQTTSDRHEGVTAFQEKRPPRFEGK